MSNLRVLGVIVSIVILAYSIYRYRADRFRMLDLIMGTILATSLVIISIFPNIANSLLGLFSFQTGAGGRLIGLLVVSNIVIFLILLQFFGRFSSVEKNLNNLVKILAQSKFREEYFKDGSGPNFPKIQVILPAYNEADNIGSVLNKIPGEVFGYKIGVIVSVDGATDLTAEIAREQDVPVIIHSINRGGGAALKAGYEIAIEAGAEVIVTIDSDGQHKPEEIPRLVEPILQNEADLVNGSRVLGHYESDNLIRALGVIFFNRLVSLLTLTRITDCSNAFRSIRASILQDLTLKEEQFHTSELLIEAIRKGYRVKEVPITILKRQSGESKKPPSIRYAWGFSKAIIKTWLR